MATVRFYRNNTDSLMDIPGIYALPAGKMVRIVADEHNDIDLNTLPGLTQIDQPVQPWENHVPSVLVFDPDTGDVLWQSLSMQ